MPYGEESQPTSTYAGNVYVTFDATFSDQETPVQASLEFSFSYGGTGDLYGAPAPTAMQDAFFQHLVDHLSTLPPFPGITETGRTIAASKTNTRGQVVTPTEAPE